MHTTSQTPHILNFNASATVSDGLCAMETVPRPDTISRLSISATVLDPYNRLSNVAQLAKGAHPYSKTVSNGSGFTSILTSCMALTFNSNGPAGSSATTVIGLAVSDPWVLFAEMFLAGFVGIDGSLHWLNLENQYAFLRHKISSLVGFEALTSETHFSCGLSSLATDLLFEVGNDIADLPRLKASLESIALDPVRNYPVGVEAELLAHVIGRLGPKINDVLPPDLSGMHQKAVHQCAGCAGSEANCHAGDYWTFAAFQPTSVPMSSPVPWGSPASKPSPTNNDEDW